MHNSNPSGWLEAGGGVAAIIAAVAAIARPWGEKARSRRQEKRIFKIWMNGQPEVKGVFDAVVAAPVRMEHMQNHLEILDNTVGKMQKGLTNLTAMVVEGRKMTQAEIKELKDMWTANGGDTNNPGDVQMRQAKRNGDWLDDKIPDDSAH